MPDNNLCPDCQVAPGEVHQGGCDIERCSTCGGQWITCGHADHDPDKTRWTGEWPGVIECREKGWYCTDGHGPHPQYGSFRPCGKDTPGAMEDLNRLTIWKGTGKDTMYDGVEEYDRGR